MDSSSGIPIRNKNTAPQSDPTEPSTTFTLPIIGVANNERVPDVSIQDLATATASAMEVEAETPPTNAAPAASTSATATTPGTSQLIMTRIVQGQSVTDEYFFLAAECRSMKILFNLLQKHLKSTHPKTWDALKGKLPRDGRPSKFLLQKTRGKGNQKFIQSDWIRPGTYSNWYNNEINHGDRKIPYRKVEIHFSESHLEEYIGPISGISNKEDMEEARERKAVPLVKRPYKRIAYVIEQKCLDGIRDQEIADSMAMGAAAAPEPRRYLPTTAKWACSSLAWFSTLKSADYIAVDSEDGEDEDEEESEEEEDDEPEVDTREYWDGDAWDDEMEVDEDKGKGKGKAQRYDDEYDDALEF
ncbi:hypothetical protein CLCR_06048 [Cladophialophora carrionii]|uniref:Uncharacterized protein n=1 Tax=Cladophialophora carrionii TaxID=86049 RepID=A0A1C1C9T5_9EURO|nr:hypothetical protein CLCR_06048 [Cladophialophora carrionii]